MVEICLRLLIVALFITELETEASKKGDKLHTSESEQVLVETWRTDLQLFTSHWPAIA